jgi:hypothetical protein
MFKKKDPYTILRSIGLFQDKNQIGTIYLEYQVSQYDNVQAIDYSSINDIKNRKFFLHCTQRIIIYNDNTVIVSPSENLVSYDNYPLLINTQIQLNPISGVLFELVDYSPVTVNTKIETSGTIGNSQGETNGSSISNTSGSSTSQTNSFSTSLNISEIPAVTAGYEYSSTSTSDHSSTNTSDSSRTHTKDLSNSASMSIKDWGAYATIYANEQSPAWNFGQEYPWDAINCRRTNGVLNPNNNEQVQIVIPSNMSVRLYDGVSLYPPSQISMFGLNFVMNAVWLVTIPNSIEANDLPNDADEITIDHILNYFTGSHSIPTTTSDAQVSVFMDKTPSILNIAAGDPLSTTINLSVMGLDPLSVKDQPAIIGFIPKRFTIAPLVIGTAVSATPFKIISFGNNILIKDTTKYPLPSPTSAGAGFTASETSLNVSFSQDCTLLQMTAYFKITDAVNNYNLIMKHWKTGQNGVYLTILINGDSTTTITKYIDATEAEGGENNLLIIALRDLDHSSINYHDYLQLGLNSVEISIQPIGGIYVKDSGYEIRAISIE